MSNYPDDIGGYSSHPQSPTYNNPYESLEELSLEELEEKHARLESSLEDLSGTRLRKALNWLAALDAEILVRERELREQLRSGEDDEDEGEDEA